jgi:hypothetical protein
MSDVAVERKYALSKVKPGDYILPSNDGKTIWRIARYTEGPSSGIVDWPRDREVWGYWRWDGEVDPGCYIDTGDWNRWEMVGGICETRAEAINDALSY